MKNHYYLLVLSAIIAISGFVITPQVNYNLLASDPPIIIPPIKFPTPPTKTVIIINSSTSSTIQAQVV